MICEDNLYLVVHEYGISFMYIFVQDLDHETTYIRIPLSGE